VAATGSYIVTAFDSAGSTTAMLSITVNDQPPTSLSYATGAAIYPQGAQIALNVPTNSGGTAISYSASPALPAGLSLSPATGIVSGAPTAVTVAASYTVTASNSGRQRNGDLEYHGDGACARSPADTQRGPADYALSPL